MTKDDVPAVLAIQSACPEIAQWSARDYTRAADGEMTGWCMEENSAVSGFIVARRVANELEILNFAVRPEDRRRGLGKSLLDHTLAWAKNLSSERAFLEVRISNLAAIRFYERNGFEVSGRRPRYYTAPVEDALVLAAPVAVPEGGGPDTVKA